MNSIVRTYFSRGNVGIREFDNPLLEAIADVIQERFEDALEHNPTLNTDLLKSILKSLNETSIKYRDFGNFLEAELVWSESSETLEVSDVDGVYAYVDEYTIYIIDDNISDGASWGCDSIKLTYDEILDRLEEMIDEVQRALKHNRYELQFDRDADTSIACVFEGLDDDDIVHREEVNRIFNDIKEYLSELPRELFYDEIPIISNNPFDTAPEVDFDWDISDGKITFRFYEVYREGASHRRSVFEVIFSPVET